MMADSWLKALILACVFGAVLLLVETLVRGISKSRSEGREINLRLKLNGQGRDRGEALNILRRTGSSIPAGLPPGVDRLARKLERTLMAAQVTTATDKLMLLLLVAPVTLFLLGLVLLFTLGFPLGFGRLLILATFCGVVGCFLPLMFLQFKANRTRKKMQDQFPVALDVFVRGLRAGHPIAAALDLRTVEMPDPIGSQFGVVVDEVTYGAELRDALESLAERWDLDDMRMFVVSLSVQSETGGNLAEILENLSQVIRERQSMMLKVRALSSEGRMTGIMLTALPVLAFTALFIGNPGFYLDVAGDPWFVPGFGGLLILYVIGFVSIRRLVDLKV
jgi:tight adherence protein B